MKENGGFRKLRRHAASCNFGPFPSRSLDAESNAPAISSGVGKRSEIYKKKIASCGTF
jgi:hypothetical protein